MSSKRKQKRPAKKPRVSLTRVKMTVSLQPIAAEAITVLGERTNVSVSEIVNRVFTGIAANDLSVVGAMAEAYALTEQF